MREQIRKILMESGKIVTRKHIEYWVETMDEYGDIIDQTIYDANERKEAMEHFEKIKIEGDIVGAILERVTRFGTGYDDNFDKTSSLAEQDYEIIAEKGQIN